MTLPNARPRNSAIELLRILAMLMIVLSHSVVHGNFDSYYYDPVSINRLFLQFSYLGNLGVDLFILISGYFLWKRPFRREALSKLLAQVWFYSLALFLVCKYLFGYVYSPEALWQVFLPSIHQEYWFFTAYLVLMLLSPFVNLLLQALSRQQHKNLLLVMLLLWVAIPTLTRSKQLMYSNETWQLLVLYCLGAYFGKYPQNRFQKASLRWGTAVGSFLLLYGLTVVLAYCERFSPEFFCAWMPLYDRCGLPTMGCAVGLFALAVYWKPFTSKLVNTISGCTFGVYLIHDNPAVRAILWQELLNNAPYKTSPSLIPRLVISVLLVFSVCTAMEYLRQKTVEAPTSRAVDHLLKKLLKQ